MSFFHHVFNMLHCSTYHSFLVDSLTHDISIFATGRCDSNCCVEVKNFNFSNKVFEHIELGLERGIVNFVHWFALTLHGFRWM